MAERRDRPSRSRSTSARRVTSVGTASAPAPDARGDLLQLGLAPRGQRDPVPRGAELLGQRRADAAARAGDDDVLDIGIARL